MGYSAGGKLRLAGSWEVAEVGAGSEGLFPLCHASLTFTPADMPFLSTGHWDVLERFGIRNKSSNWATNYRWPMLGYMCLSFAHWHSGSWLCNHAGGSLC